MKKLIGIIFAVSILTGCDGEIVEFVCDPSVDFDRDGEVTLLDLGDFLVAKDEGNSLADLNCDGVLNDDDDEIFTSRIGQSR